MIDIDIFAAGGGWDTGLRYLGVPSPIGVEWDAVAVATARAAGHIRLDADRGDVSAIDIPAFVADWADPLLRAGDTAPCGLDLTDKVRLLIASPPCQAWSRAGKRQGILDQPRIFDHLTAVQHAGRWIDYDRDGWRDDRSPLVLELVRWVDALRPERVVAEQVPDVLPFWQQVCAWLRTIGYSAVSGLLSSEQYGVPQTRQRAFLVARRDGRPARLPAPSHARYVAPRGSDVQGDGLFDAPEPVRIVPPGERHLLPWVSMADALGWGGNAADRPARTMCGDRSPRWMYDQGEGSYGTGWTLHTSSGYEGRETTREHDQPAPTVTGESRPGWYMRTEQKRGSDRAWVERDGAAPAPTLTTSMDGWTLRQSAQDNATVRDLDEPAPTVLNSRSGNLRWQLRNGTQDNACTRALDEPAGTMFFGQRGNAVDWVSEGVGGQGWDGQTTGSDGGAAVRITVQQAGVLQSFPPSYPWQGTKTAQFRQVGDAVPPLLGAAVAGEVLDIDWRTRLWSPPAQVGEAA